MTLPELLSPAGDWDCLKAAVANGADAVYFGVDAFNARQRAENFRIEELGEVMTWLHERKVRGFLTFNVLVFSDELERAASLVIAAAAAIGRGHWPGGIWLAGARITRPNEAWSLEPLIRARPDGYLVRNADQLERLTPLAPCVGDFSLNTANPLSVRWYLEHWGWSG